MLYDDLLKCWRRITAATWGNPKDVRGKFVFSKETTEEKKCCIKFGDIKLQEQNSKWIVLVIELPLQRLYFIPSNDFHHKGLKNYSQDSHPPSLWGCSSRMVRPGTSPTAGLGGAGLREARGLKATTVSTMTHSIMRDPSAMAWAWGMKYGGLLPGDESSCSWGKHI